MSSVNGAGNRVPPCILVVDDNQDYTKLIEEVLENAGYSTAVVHSGEDAISHLKKHDVDLVLLDIIMPEMDGFAVAEKMREILEKDSFIPTILVSALDAQENKIKGLASADDYITKPFSYDELLARIKALLRIRDLQKELNFSRYRYQYLYDSIPVMCVSLNKSMEISDCNSAFCKVVNLGKRGVVNRHFFSFFDKGEHSVLQSYFGDLESGKLKDKNLVFEMNGRNKNNEKIKVTIEAVHIGSNESELLYVITMQDVTESQKYEWERKVARMQLYRAARLASIGTLASGVAHELNNPLAAILGFSDALLHRLDNNEKIEQKELDQYLRIIGSETLRCRDIIENLSKFAREREPQMHSVSLKECINSALMLIKPKAQKRNIKIIDKIDNDVTILTDFQKMGQVFIHILSNSIDFSREGDSVTLETEKQRVGEYVKIRISDTGAGISEDVLPRVFDPFFTTKEVGKGFGIGLAICHNIIEECDGLIDISSEDGKGTTVTLEIPKG